jgi:hypothetical protein
MRGGKSAHLGIFPPPKYTLPIAQIPILDRSPSFCGISCRPARQISPARGLQ